MRIKAPSARTMFDAMAEERFPAETSALSRQAPLSKILRTLTVERLVENRHIETRNEPNQGHDTSTNKFAFTSHSEDQIILLPQGLSALMTSYNLDASPLVDLVQSGWN